jgi:hypothetical protein
MLRLSITRWRGSFRLLRHHTTRDNFSGSALIHHRDRFILEQVRLASKNLILSPFAA